MKMVDQQQVGDKALSGAIKTREGKADTDIRPIFMGKQRRMEETLLQDDRSL
jgi:hypothetical protein